MSYSNRDPNRVYDQLIEAKKAKQHKYRLCLQCLTSFSSFGPQNRICDSCSTKITAYSYSEEVFTITVK